MVETLMIKTLSDNGISKVTLQGQWVYKTQPAFLATNEIWCLERLAHTDYVPWAVRDSINTIRLKYIEPEAVTDPVAFMAHYAPVLRALDKAGIRHGDLTEKNILVRDNRPLLIDFAESRLVCDPRADKRPRGDRWWLKKGMKRLCEGTE